MSVVIGACVYLYIIISTILQTGEGFSFATYALWSALAWITGYTTMKKKGPFGVPMMYGVGATSMAAILLFKGRFSWNMMDTIVAILVFVCLFLLVTSGTRCALVMSVIGAVIASVPFTIMTWENPEASPIIANAGFLVSNFLLLLSAGKPREWTIENSLYGGVNTISCGSLVLPWLLNLVK